MGSGTPSPARIVALAASLNADLAAVELFAALEERSLDALLLRGAGIALRLYEAGDRGYADCDVLVSERTRSAVENVLRSLGYEPFTPLVKAQHWRRERDLAEIDLHRSLRGAGVARDAFWAAMKAHRSTVELRGATIPVPDEAASALVIVLHVAQHGRIVVHPLEDLRRALELWDETVWRDAAALAGELNALIAFRQGLAMLPSGLERLGELGMTPGVNARSVMRSRGIELPEYLEEALPLRERTAMLARRVCPGRAEITMTVDPRAAHSVPHLLAAHARRISRISARAARLSIHWRYARREARSFGKEQAGG